LSAASTAAQQPPQPAPEPDQARKPQQQLSIPGAGDEIRIGADVQSFEGGHYRGEGFVDLQSGQLRIQSDALDMYETEKPDGGKGRRVVAVGNVVFMRGEERLAGTRLEMDLDTSYAVMNDAVGYLEPGVWVQARRIERLDANVYRVEGGKFTSCAQPNPRWGFTASSATIEVDDKIKAKNVTFRVKSVPALYIPYLVYPIQQDQRSTGVLFPHFGYSSLRGFNLGTGFFWAMGRSFDQTLYLDRYSRFGYGVGHEFRYVRQAPSRGTFKTYVFQPRAGSELDYDVDWNALQLLPGNFRATLLVRQYSNLQFQQQFQDNFNLATTRSRRSMLALQGTLGRSTLLQLTAESMDTFFADDTYTNRRLPSLRLAQSPRRLGRTGLVFGWETRAEYVGNNFTTPEVSSYSRVDVAPELSRSFSTSYLQVTPRLRPRVTHYGRTLDEDNAILGPARLRPLFEGGLEVRGPSFSKVFGNPFGFYTDRLKHVIGPEVTWTYRTRVDDFDAIPKLDGYDQLLGTNQIDFALVNQLYAKRPSPSGKPTAQQFLTWRLQQTYYMQISSNQNEFDPNYSSVFFGVGGVPSHKSPLLSRLRLRPTPSLFASFDVEYDTNFRQFRSLGVSATANGNTLSFQGGWTRLKRVARRVENRVTTADVIRAGGRLKLPGELLAIDGNVNYDLLQKRLVNYSTRIRVGVQCCGLMVERIAFNFAGRKDQITRFSIELANIGSIGNFMGQEADVRRQGLAGQP
jgi:LPS-assembly protein